MENDAEARLVCVVADEPESRAAIDILIRGAGFEVHTFSSTRDYLEQHTETPVACLILDVSRPLSDGLDLLRREMPRSGHRAPVVFVTGPAIPPGALRALHRGASEFLIKPFREEDLIDALARLTGRDDVSSDATANAEAELREAAEIQQGLMALSLPQPGFAAIAGRNLPCAEVGGDFFMALTLDDQIVIAIADIAGKGIAAAVMASALQGMIHEGLRRHVPLPVIAHDANEFFAGRETGSKYATCVIMRLQGDGVLEYLNCGHVRPVIVQGSNVSTAPETNFPVGLIPGVEYSSAKMRLSPGDRVILVTDGVTEAESHTGEFFGTERLLALAGEGLNTEEIFDAVQQFCGDHPMNDDCTIIGLDYVGVALEMQSEFASEKTL
jgi:FixJ family two-component response regulator